MKRRAIGVVLSAVLVGSTFALPNPVARAAKKGVDLGGTIRAGYGVADNTWHVGASAGQYAQKEYEGPGDVPRGVTGGDVDPHGHSPLARDSYGVQSRLTFRALVVEDAEGDHAAFVKSDNYLAMDALQRRVGQILAEEGSEITYDGIMHMASHNHFSPMYSTPSIGVWLFQDVMDLRAFEYQARQMAKAILMAEDDLQPARMGATEVKHYLFKGMVARRTIGDDGTPVGYPLDFGDFGLPVIRFDSLDGDPIATLVNWGMHPEGLDDDNLITAEFLAPLERFVERATGSPVVFGQGDVGSSESGPARPYHPDWPTGVFRQWDNAGHAQVERGGWLLAQDVIHAWHEIGGGKGLVPFDDDFDVAAGNAWVPGPLSHPYPSYGNCRTEAVAEGAPGVPTTPTCQRPPTHDRSRQIWENLRAHGIPLPEYYSPNAFMAVEENLRLHLQAFKLGEVVLMSCACEAQVDLILNLESRTNETEGDMWLGYDWTKRLDCTENPPPEPNAETTWTCQRKENDTPDAANHPTAPGSTFLDPLTFPNAAMQRMKAQIYNDAAGWNELEYIPFANSDPPNPADVKGNFTHQELSEELGYKLPIGVGHAGDYNGYTVSYREYMAYDHYRKALTSYGPHTADYMNTVLVELAGELNDEDADETYELEDQDEYRARADEQRQEAFTTALGQASSRLYDEWRASLPDDTGPPGPTEDGQPRDITRFDSTIFSWVGGSNAVDNPTVEVQHLVDGQWVDFADQSGEVQTMVDFPDGLNGFVDTYAGNQEWVWTANFEAFNAFPKAIGSTSEGEYRFVVDGVIRQDSKDGPYHLESDSFRVDAWNGLKVENLRLEDEGAVSFTVDSTYPGIDDNAAFPYVKKHMKDERSEREEIMPGDRSPPWCDTCSFRPWATRGEVVEAVVAVTRADGTTDQVTAQQGPDGRWHAATDLYVGERAQIEAGRVVDDYGERNGEASLVVEGTRERPVDGPEQTALTLKVEGHGSKRVLNAVLTELDSGTPIADRDIKFYANDTLIGSSRTSSAGIATLNAPPRYRGGSFTFRAVFEGDLAYLGSWATATT